MALVVVSGFVLFYSLYPVFAAPPTTKYAPGEITDPNCYPGDTNCDVYAPLSLDAWDATTTDALGEGLSNLYYTDARSRSALSSSATGLTFTSSTGIFTLTSNYLIPLSASTTDWNTAYGWGNHATQGYITTAGETDPIWIAASTSFANLSSSNIFTGTSNIFNSTNPLIYFKNSTTTITDTVPKLGVFVFQDKNGAQGGYLGYGSAANSSLSINNAIGPVRLMTGGTAASNVRLFVDQGGNVGIGTGLDIPSTTLQVVSTTEQLRLGYNYANYTSFTVGSDGALTITPTNSATTTITGGIQSTTGFFRTTDAGATSAVLQGTMANGATGVGVILDNSVSQATAGGKLVSIRNANVEKAYVDYLGNINAGAGTAALPSYSFAGNPGTGMMLNTTNQIGWSLNGTQYMKLAGANLQAAGLSSLSATKLSLNGLMADGASSIGVAINASTAQTTAGAKIASFQNSAVEKAYVDYLGGMYVATGTVALPGLGAKADADTGIYWPAANNLGLNTGGTERMIIDGSGNIGIGTSTPAFKFQVYLSASNEGHVDAAGAWANTSDERLKKNVITLDSALEKVMQLRGVRYDWRTEEDAVSSTRIGFIAQEMEQIFPQFVSAGNNGIKGIAYGSLTPVLVEAIKEQQGEILNIALILPANFTSTTMNGLKIDENILTTEIITGQELDNFDWLVKNSLKKLGMLIKDGVAKLKELVAGKITAQNELCVGSTCMNENQLKTLLQDNSQSLTPEPAPTTSESSNVSEVIPPAVEIPVTQVVETPLVSEVPVAPVVVEIPLVSEVPVVSATVEPSSTEVPATEVAPLAPVEPVAPVAEIVPVPAE